MAATAGGSTGPNARLLDDTLAETGPGIPDDAVLQGEFAPGDLGRDAEASISKLQHDGWMNRPVDEVEGESQAHPS